MGTWAPYFVVATVAGVLAGLTVVALGRSGKLITLIGAPVGVAAVVTINLAGVEETSAGDALVLMTACLLGGLVGSCSFLYGRWIVRVFKIAESRISSGRQSN